MNCLSFKLTFLCFLLMTIFSCHSPIKEIQNTHKSTVNKWRGLAEYAHGDLSKHSLFIAASFTLIEKNAIKRVVIKDFKITNQVSSTQVDLLKPSFYNKLVCSPECYFLNEYFFENEDIKNSIMGDFFKTYEFQLFDFYSQLFVLNKKLKILEKNNTGHLKMYLNTIINDNKSYKSLDELGDFLNSSLTLEKFKSFSENPKDTFLSNEPKANDNAFWFTNNGFITANQESKLWVNKESTIEAVWLNKGLNNIPESNKIEDFYISDTVCTRYNSVGTIMGILGDQLLIQEFALTKILSDGMLTAPRESFLRIKNEAYTYVPYDNEVTIPSAEVFSCEVK